MSVGKQFLYSVLLVISSLTVADVPFDRIPNSLSLPDTYPDSWIFIHDINYPALVMGKFLILDVAAEAHQHKGQFQGAQLAGFVESRTRSELYVAETFYSRAGRGQRTDALTVYSKADLKPIAEIPLPGEKRALMLSKKGLMRMSRNDQFALIYNFTPGASVTVVDMNKRAVVNEVPIPSCSLIYPSGKRGFATFCANGTLASYVLDSKGQVVSEHMSTKFNDIDNDALYMQPALIKGTAYFPSFTGRVQPIALSRSTPKILPTWPLLSDEERQQAWATSTGQSIASDRNGRLYVRMHKVREDGSHQADSSEVWVFDVNKQRRERRMALKNEAYAIEVTQGRKPYLVAQTAEGFDIYHAVSGDYIRTIGGWWPYAAVHSLLHASQP